MLKTMQDLKGYKIEATDGEVGYVEEIYFDETSWDVRYIIAAVGGWFSRQYVLLSPASVMSVDNSVQTIVTRLSKEQIKSSPDIDTHKPISREIEEAIHAHYQWQPYWIASSMGTVSAEPHLSAVTPPTPVAYPHFSESDEVQNEIRSTLRSSSEVAGYNIKAKDGAIGHVETFYIDTAHWKVRYIIVDTRNWLPGKHVIVSPAWVTGINWSESTMTLSLPQEAIEGSPEYNPQEAVKRSYEESLFQYYDRAPYWDM